MFDDTRQQNIHTLSSAALEVRSQSTDRSLVERVSEPLLALLIISAPVLYWGTTDAYRARVLLFSLPLLLCGLATRFAPVAVNGWIRWGLAAIFLGLAIGAVQAEHQTAAWLRLLELAWCGVLSCLAAGWVSRNKRLAFSLLVSLAVAYSISNSRLAVEWLLQQDPKDRDWSFAVPGYFHYRNLGFAAAPALIVLAWLPFSRRVRAIDGSRRVVIVGVVLVAATLGWAVLAWSGSRAGVLCTGVGITVLFLLQRRHLPTSRYFACTLICVIVGSIVSIPFIPNEGSFGLLRIVDRAVGGDGLNEYSSGRIEIYLDGLRRLSEVWDLGLGPDQYQHQPRLPSRILEPHNSLVQIGLEGGVLGLIGLLVTALGFIRLVWFAFSKLCTEVREHASVVVAVIVAYAAYSLIDGVLFWMLPQVYLWILAGCLAGLMFVTDRNAPAPTPRYSFFKVTSAGIMVVVAGAFLIVQQQSEALAARSVPEPDSMIARSVYKFPGATWGVLRWIQEWDNGARHDVAERWLLRMIEQSPAPYYYRVEYGYFLVRRERFLEALRQIEQGIAEAPLASVARMQKQNEGLIRELRAALAKAL